MTARMKVKIIDLTFRVTDLMTFCKVSSRKMKSINYKLRHFSNSILTRRLSNCPQCSGRTTLERFQMCNLPKWNRRKGAGTVPSRRESSKICDTSVRIQWGSKNITNLIAVSCLGGFEQVQMENVPHQDKHDKRDLNGEDTFKNANFIAFFQLKQ